MEMQETPQFVPPAAVNSKPATDIGCLGSGSHANIDHIVFVQSGIMFEQSVYPSSIWRDLAYLRFMEKLCASFISLNSLTGIYYLHLLFYWPAAMGVDCFVNLLHNFDGFVQSNNYLVVMLYIFIG